MFYWTNDAQDDCVLQDKENVLKFWVSDQVCPKFKFITTEIWDPIRVEKIVEGQDK